MIKLKAAIYVFTKSLTSPKYYNDIVKTNFGFSMKYFSVLALISSLVAFSGLVKPIMTDLGDSLKAVETTVVDSFPDDLEITVKDGEVSINQPEPYIFQTPEEGFESTMEEGQEVPRNLLVFDSKGTLDDLERYDTLFLVNKSNILAQSSNKIEVYPLDEFPNGTFGAEDIKGLLNEVRPFIDAIPYIVLAVALLGTIVYYFGFRLVFLLVVALVLFAVGNLRGLRMKYSKYYQVGIHALTLPLIIEVLSGVFEYPINMPFWFLTLTVLIGVIGLFNIDKDSVEGEN
ncbi:DUF1189 family protein [candidate division WWE3 bacterium]|jgi:hypothetical protein|nr:DUF1189 family protein [candidate division WWE3 bacterium]MBT7350243.1 DUF1189 family protein [candidate division WWE3 bacterium]